MRADVGGASPLGKARWVCPVCRASAQRPLAQKRAPQWTPADTQAPAVTRVRHTRAVHAPALCRTSDCTCLCVDCSKKLSSTSPTTIPVRILREVDSVRARWVCPVCRASAQRPLAQKRGTTVDTSRHTSTRSHSLTLSHSFSLILTHSHSLSLTLTHSHSLSHTLIYSDSLSISHSLSLSFTLFQSPPLSHSLKCCAHPQCTRTRQHNTKLPRVRSAAVSLARCLSRVGKVFAFLLRRPRRHAVDGKAKGIPSLLF